MTGLLPLARRHPMLARNLLFIVIAVPLLALGQAAGWGGAHVATLAGPVVCVVAALLVARVLATRLGIPLR
jgi:glucose-6-phosphate-specific signal transduction histidine kinase